MADRPILFSAPMVRALLAGTKTQTRRLLKPQPAADSGPLTCGEYHPTKVDRSGEEYPGPLTYGASSEDGSFATPIRIRPGDRLWVREAHALLPRSAYRMSIGTGTIAQREHPTDGYTAAVFREGFDRSGRPQWRPSIHMPRWASRLTLTVTNVRVQRLQDISEEDALAEGMNQATAEAIMCPDELHVFSYAHIATPHALGRIIFETIWEHINGAGAWAANPWVVAYSFTVERRNIDAEG